MNAFNSFLRLVLVCGLTIFSSVAVAQGALAAAPCETALGLRVAKDIETRAQAYEANLNQIEASLKNPKAGVFGPDSMMWKVFRERALLVGLARMGIMQMADPRVSEIMLSSSKFNEQPIVRMENTVLFLKTLIYGDWNSARKMSNAIFKIHQRVQNENRVPTAELDDLMLWVHASTWDSVLLAYEKLVGKLSATELEKFYSETKTFGLLLGLPESVIPQNYSDFKKYVDEKSATLVLSEPTKIYLKRILGNNDILKQVLPEKWPIDLDRTRNMVVAGAVYLLPASIKEQMAVQDLPWMNSILGVGFSAVKTLMPVIPSRLRYSRAYLAAIQGVPDKDRPKCPFHEFFKN